jgi:hypothetical protein
MASSATPKELSMSTVAMSTFLRRVLTADALISAAAGLVMVAGAGVLHEWLQLPPSLLRVAGIALFPWAACLMWLARKPAVPRAAVWAVIVLNLVWIADSVWVAVGGGYAPNGLGQAFIGLQALVVAVLAELEFTGLRRASARPAVSFGA